MNAVGEVEDRTLLREERVRAMPSERNDRPRPCRVGADRRKKKPKMPRLLNEKTLMIVSLSSRAGAGGEGGYHPDAHPPVAMGIGCTGDATLGPLREGAHPSRGCVVGE